MIWRRSLRGSGLLSVYVEPLMPCFCLSLRPADRPFRQIRIITDTHSHLHPKKKKKPHRGYAFVVFERERDMRGTFPPLLPFIPFARWHGAPLRLQRGLLLARYPRIPSDGMSRDAPFR